MKRLMLVIFCIILSAFIFSLFKNIQYPLLWNDETETVMYAKRILQYGYPKIHDGKNIVFLTELPDKQFGIDKRTDSASALVWGQYYFAAIGAYFAEKVDDIYLKTAFLRIPFALAGLFGLAVLALSIINTFGKKALQKLIFLTAFFFFALLSISLTLHLREVRHPALDVFLSACIIYTYLGYRFYKKIGPISYFILLASLLFLLYHVFHAIFFIFIAAIGVYEGGSFLKEMRLRRFLINTAPLFAASIMAIPFFFLCQTYAAGRASAAFYHMPPWSRQVFSFLHFFQEYEFLYLVLFVKAVLFCVWIYCLARRLDPGQAVRQKMQISNFLGIFFITYGLVVTLFPSPIIFERYYTVLIPILTLIMLLDTFATIEIISRIPHRLVEIWVNGLYALMLLSVFLLNGSNKVEHLKGHAYELFHQYKGPLDFAIPFIKSCYKNTENLVIATNYEELAYMYYLGSRVIVGYVGNNLDEDLKMQPDVIVLRKKWARVDPAVFNQFLDRGRYKKISFPILDYPVNNIPERNCEFIRHLYKTPLCNDENKCLDILIRSTENVL